MYKRNSVSRSATEEETGLWLGTYYNENAMKTHSKCFYDAF